MKTDLKDVLTSTKVTKRPRLKYYVAAKNGINPSASRWMFLRRGGARFSLGPRDAVAYISEEAAVRALRRWEGSNRCNVGTGKLFSEVRTICTNDIQDWGDSMNVD